VTNERATSVTIGSSSNPTTTSRVTSTAGQSEPRSGRELLRPLSRNARSWRARVALATISEAPTITSCRIDNAAAACRSSSWVVWYQISVSIVP